MKKTITACSTAFAMLIIGCADTPNPIGDNLREKGNTFMESTVIAYSDTAYRTPIVNGYSSSNLVGKLPTGEEFVTLLEFYPTSVADSLRGAKIDTAEIRLTVNYRMLPASPPITLNVYEVLQPFSEATFTSDSLQPSSVGTISLGMFSDSMNFSQQVVARIDTNVARRWADDYLDTSKPDFHGFAVKMLANSGVIGFTPFNVFSTVVPSLVIKYTKNGKLDSLTFGSGQDTHIGMYATTPSLSDLEVRGAVGVRSKLKFDVQFLTGNPIVARSILSMAVDTALSVYSGYTQDSLVAILALPGTNIDTSSSSFFSYGVKKSSPGTVPVYEFQVTEITQQWINSLSVNEGLTIRWLAETSSSERIVFYSIAEPDSAKRPKLNILYSERKQ